MSSKPKVLDASPLIHLVRGGAGGIFQEVEEPFLAPPSVHREVVGEGLNRGRADAAVVDELVRGGRIHIRRPQAKNTRRILTAAGGPRGPLDTGEAEVMVLAEEAGGIAIIDERSARQVGRVLGIEVRGSGYLLAWMVAQGKMSPREAVAVVDRMVEGGWRVSPEVYRAILRGFEVT